MSIDSRYYVVLQAEKTKLAVFPNMSLNELINNTKEALTKIGLENYHTQAENDLKTYYCKKDSNYWTIENIDHTYCDDYLKTQNIDFNQVCGEDNSLFNLYCDRLVQIDPTKEKLNIKYEKCSAGERSYGGTKLACVNWPEGIKYSGSIENKFNRELSDYSRNDISSDYFINQISNSNTNIENIKLLENFKKTDTIPKAETKFKYFLDIDDYPYNKSFTYSPFFKTKIYNLINSKMTNVTPSDHFSSVVIIAGAFLIIAGLFVAILYGIIRIVSFGFNTVNKIKDRFFPKQQLLKTQSTSKIP